MIRRVKAGVVPIEPSYQTRLLFEEVYGVSVDRQLKIEQGFDNMTQVGAVFCPSFLDFASESQKLFYDHFSKPLEEFGADMLVPSGFKFAFSFQIH